MMPERAAGFIHDRPAVAVSTAPIERSRGAGFVAVVYAVRMKPLIAFAIAPCLLFACAKSDRDKAGDKPAPSETKSTPGGDKTPATPPVGKQVKAPPTPTATGAQPGASRPTGQPAGATVPKVRYVIDTSDQQDFPLEFLTEGLPAVSADGKQIAIGHRQADGARGLPNFTVWVQDVATDKRTQEYVVLSVEQLERLHDEEDGEAKLEDLMKGPLAEARKALKAGSWLQMAEGEAEVDAGEVAEPAQADGLVVVLKEPTLTVTAQGKVLMKREVPDWSAPKTKHEDIECENPAYVGRAYVHRALRVLLVQVSYAGTDTCWEPEDQFHAFRLPE